MATDETQVTVDEQPVVDTSRELSFSDIMATDDRELVKVEIPQWKGHVYIRTLSALEAIEFQQHLSNPAKKQHAMTRIVTLCVADSKGNRLLTDDKTSEFAKKNVKVFVVLQDKALELNGFTKKRKPGQTDADLNKEATDEAKND
jgi:hypothetical protein